MNSLLDMIKGGVNSWNAYNQAHDNKMADKYGAKFGMSGEDMAKSWGNPYQESVDLFQKSSNPAPQVNMYEGLEPEGVSEEVDPREFAKTFNVNDSEQVSQFQRLMGLKDDGVFGPKTEAALRGVQGVETAKDPYGFGERIKRAATYKGDLGEDINRAATYKGDFREDVNQALHYGPDESSFLYNLTEDIRNAFRRDK